MEWKDVAFEFNARHCGPFTGFSRIQKRDGAYLPVDFSSIQNFFRQLEVIAWDAFRDFSVGHIRRSRVSDGEVFYGAISVFPS
jgi:hypothetical protein